MSDEFSPIDEPRRRRIPPREPDYDEDDFYDDEPAPRRRRDVRREQDLGDDPAIRMLLPVGRSGWAIAAGYLGLLSLACFPAPLAIITGCIALWDIHRHPEKHGMGRAIFGIVMGTLASIPLFVYLALVVYWALGGKRF